MKNKFNVNPLLHATLPLVIAIAYVLIGTFCHRGWAIGWILFLLIPIVESLYKAIQTRNASAFAYPVFVTAVFLFLGLMFSWWHPTWVLFLTIPVYYAICDSFKRSRQVQAPQGENTVDCSYNEVKSNENTTQEGTYYNPPVNTPVQPQKNSNGIVNIIITAIVCIAVICIVGIVFAFSWLNDNIDNPFRFYNDNTPNSSVIIGSDNISTDGINDINIEWVNGNINVSYYDKDTIAISESDVSQDYKMVTKIEGGTLYIDEFDSDIKSFNHLKDKDLEVFLPRDFELYELEIDAVSANVDIENLKANEFKLDIVSGNSNIGFETQPRKIDIDSVSGNSNVTLPNDISGYIISTNSISGSINCKDFDNQMEYGDRLTKISLESVSGNYTFVKAK